MLVSYSSPDDSWEVISGVPPFRTLQDLFDDHEVPCCVRDVGDDEAKWIALAENLDREDLTPISSWWR